MSHDAPCSRARTRVGSNATPGTRSEGARERRKGRARISGGEPTFFKHFDAPSQSTREPEVSQT